MEQSKKISRKVISVLLSLLMVFSCFSGMSLTALADGHTHNFEYSASGDTITATCKNEGCSLTENKVTLTIVPNPVLYYNDGQPKEASLEGLEAFNAATGKNISTDNIAYYKGDTNVTAQIKAGSGTSIKISTYTARLDVEGKRATVSFRLTAKPTPHTHVFTYNAEGNVITATCTQNASNMDACDLTNKQSTLTLNAPLHTTYGDGKDANATFTGEIPGVTNPTIHYSKGSVTLSSAPTDAGTYTAWCQLGNATARVEYTVAKAVNPGYTTLPHAVENLVYTGAAQELVTAGVTNTGQIAYTAGTDPDNEPDVNAGGMPYTYSVPKMTDAGTYYVWCKLDGGKNYTSLGAQKIAVTIAKANPTYSVPTGLTATYGDTLSSVVLPEGWAWVDGTTNVGDVGKKTFKANFTPADTTNYNVVENVDVTVKVNQAEITPTVTLDGWTYGETANKPIVTGNAGNGDVTYLYKEKGASDMSCTDVVPTEAGEYTVKALVYETQNYTGGEAEADFTIAKAKVTITADDKTSKREAALKELTYKVDGKILDGDDLGIKVSSDVKADVAGKYDIKVAYTENANYDVSVVDGIYTVTDRITATEKTAGKNKINSAAKATASKKGVTVKWGAVANAEQYEIYATYCGNDSKYKKIKTVKGNVTSFEITKLGGKKVDTSKCLKVYVVAYRKVNGKYEKISKSFYLHIAGAQNKHTNAKAINVKKSSYTLKVNKTATMKPTLVLEKKNKKAVDHVAKFRYLSTNTAVATVDKNGKITAKGKGTCTIYIFANNGKLKSVKVTVK